MCLAIPGKVKEVKGKEAVVDFDGVKKTVRVDLIDSLEEGEWILNHAGFAIKKIPEKEASRTRKTFDNFLEKEGDFQK